MRIPRALLYRARSWLHRRDVTVWYDPRYRLPLSGLEGGAGVEPRRADYALWWLRETRAVPARSVRTPRRISYQDLARVHTPELLESLGQPQTLAHVFAVDPSDVPVDEVMTTVRLACGGTLGGARETLRTRVPALNLLGGFVDAREVAIGGGDEIGSGQALVLEDPPGPAAQPDKPDLEAVVGSGAAGGAERFRGDDHRKAKDCGGGGGMAEEFASFHRGEFLSVGCCMHEPETNPKVAGVNFRRLSGAMDVHAASIVVVRMMDVAEPVISNQ